MHIAEVHYREHYCGEADIMEPEDSSRVMSEHIVFVFRACARKPQDMFSGVLVNGQGRELKSFQMHSICFWPDWQYSGVSLQGNKGIPLRLEPTLSGREYTLLGRGQRFLVWVG